MHKIIKITFIALFAIICFTTNYASAQEQAPTYQSLVASGDKEFAKKEYIKAKTCYQEALRIKPNDATAKSKLNKTLDAIREESKKEEQFFEHLDKADAFYDNGDFQNALMEYDNALKIMPKDEYAQSKKAEITQTLQNEKEKLDSFNNMVALGDKLLSGEKYAEAVMQYESALKLYPNSNSAKAKLKEANDKNAAYNLKVSEFERFKKQGHDFELRKKYSEAIESYQKALQIFPQETEISAIVSSLQAKKDVADRYDEKINEADTLYEDQSYLAAKSAYLAALTVIPDDSYAQGMISRIEEIVNSDEYVSIQREKEKLDNDFATLINKGGNAEGFQNYELAISYYTQALELKPGNQMAVSKKENAENQLLRQQQLAKERERQAAIEAEKQRIANIQNLINVGNQQITDKKYAEAELTFKELLKLDPNNETANAQLEVIAGFYEEIQRQKEENYQFAMSEGAAALANQDYTEALKQFNIALANKPNDEAATQQLASAQQMEDLRLAALQNEYDTFIAKADGQFNTKNFDKAIELYTKAANLNTGNPYPANKIKEIGDILAANRLAVLVAETTTINANQTKRFDFQQIDVTARRSNYLFIRAKNLGTEQYTMYVSYGSSNGQNGGFVVNVPANQDVNDFIIRIGSQYKWFSEDNIWIEVSPENGDVEISSMEISKSN
ncbi:MAG: tetratricopeptide repeat protein [Bacteroidales bacterium]|nr:tetratricopeptide repeat protein [Bacteroidales bacterium]